MYINAKLKPNFKLLKMKKMAISPVLTVDFKKFFMVRCEATGYNKSYKAITVQTLNVKMNELFSPLPAGLASQ